MLYHLRFVSKTYLSTIQSVRKMLELQEKRFRSLFIWMTQILTQTELGAYVWIPTSSL